MDDKIEYEKLQHDINREKAKILALSIGKLIRVSYRSRNTNSRSK